MSNNYDEMIIFNKFSDEVCILATMISEWDVTVFNKGETTNFNNCIINRNDDKIVVQRAYNYKLPHEDSKLSPFTTAIASKKYTSDPYVEHMNNIFSKMAREQYGKPKEFSVYFIFDTAGNFTGYDVYGDTNNLKYSLKLGQKKILFNNTEWYNYSEFHETAFQHSVAHPKEPFDIFVASTILRSFHIEG